MTDHPYQLIPAIEREKFLIELKEPNAAGSRIAPFAANTFQTALDASVGPGKQWHVILKPRQVGISTYVDQRLLAKCLLVPGTHAAIISHEKTATTRLLRKVHLTLDDLIRRNVKMGGFPVETAYSSKFEITFPHQNSSLYVGTAGQRAFSRGDMLTDVHGSEVAFWPNAENLMTGLVGALVGSAELFLESTANGMGGYFFDMVKKCEAPGGPATLHFFPWHKFKEYSTEPPKDALWSPDELNLAQRFGLTGGQLWWRRKKMAQYAHQDLFFQEFPMTIDEAFIVAGACYFDKEALRDAQKRTRAPLVVGSAESVGHRAIVRPMDQGTVQIFRHPKPTSTYIIGADCAEGVEGGDANSAVVLDRETLEEVAWLSGLLDPDEGAKALFALGQYFNWAWLGVEDNGPGLAVLFKLKELGYPKIYYRTDPEDEKPVPKLGHHTDARTRPLQLGALRALLKARKWGTASAQFLRQCTTFCRQADGGYRANSGSHDDDVMAASIAAFLHQRLPVEVPPAERERESRILDSYGQKMRYGHRTGY